MLDTKKKSIEEYNYALPDERIARFPLEKRDESKLLLYENGSISHTVFKNIADYLPEKSLMVFNNTKVIQARILFQKETGAFIEVFCLEPHTPSDYVLAFQTTGHCVWKCFIGNAKRWKSDVISKHVTIGTKDVELSARRISEEEGTAFLVEFTWNDPTVTYSEILENGGQLPIPPYLHRETCERDKETYQTVYSKIKGSVAAPTAGLHFTEAVFESLRKRNIDCEEVTLHVGAGTFKPVKSDTIGEHEMHTEFICVRRSVIERLIANDCLAVAVGTTSVRTLESLYYIGVLLADRNWTKNRELKVLQWMPYETTSDITAVEAMKNILGYLDATGQDTIKADTQIIIVPSYKFKVVKSIVTNFHQPKSTLLLLISAYVGDDWKRIYKYALENDFRFLSYGDSSLLKVD
ncbi:MAG TPA: S-adenosylmethionine:tRNA ribosyltransferase-isomerase [Paludibacteraceae bacterium]|nr:S-adenosylmethionine:tRNA ribosyltransferase-isomerase [Paludibacteraceae bacterium]HPH63663.1 S-adenosylmethionine:tRNA ribosyltransferase-isomerase [Paludibacteraceae bacterium]